MHCLDCKREFELDQSLLLCSECGGLLELEFVIKNIPLTQLKGRGVWKYAPLLAGDYPFKVSLGEGSTPLIRSRVYPNLYYKFEGTNPTGSFKDRGMCVAVSSALKLGYKSVIVASTGNTAASAAAYSARAGLQAYLLLPSNNVAKGKIAQALLHGAKLIEVSGGFDSALENAIQLYRNKRTLYPLNSYNPWRLEGQKTLSFEVFEDIGVPDYVFVPVGNGGNIYAIWKGFKELEISGLSSGIPRMFGVQAKDASPIVRAIENNLSELRFIESPQTIASAIRIGKPVNWKKTIKAITDSHGGAISVSDEEILKAQVELARVEGVGVEPASAASFAGYKKLMKEGKIDQNSKVVCVLTGHALKDPETIIQESIKIESQFASTFNSVDEVFKMF